MDKKVDQEDFTLKKIRYYQASIADFDTYWKQKSAQGEAEESAETKSLKKVNADLNKDYRIVPVTPGDDTPEPTKPKKRESK